jgi:hypothetical protein
MKAQTIATATSQLDVCTLRYQDGYILLANTMKQMINGTVKTYPSNTSAYNAYLSRGGEVTLTEFNSIITVATRLGNNLDF